MGAKSKNFIMVFLYVTYVRTIDSSRLSVCLSSSPKKERKERKREKKDKKREKKIKKKKQKQ